MKNRVLFEYSLLSLLFTAMIAFALSKWIVKQTSEFALSQHASFLMEYFDSIPTNYSELAGYLENGRTPDEHAVDHFVRDLFLFPSIARIRFADSDGKLIWESNNDHPLIEELSLYDLVQNTDDGINIKFLELGAELRPGLSILYPYKVDGRTTAYLEATDVDQTIHKHLSATRLLVILTVSASGTALYFLLFLLFYRSYRNLRQSNLRLEKTQEVTIRTMSRLAELRDNETGAHIDRTSKYCEILSEELRRLPKYTKYIDHRYIDDLRRSAPLHDIGKVGIPDSILNKPGPLDKAEWDQMRLHTTYGADVLRAAIDELDFQSYFEIGLQVVIGHHENWDGSGYPNGIAGEQIPLSARIMALADVYDALRTTRPYKEPISHVKAIEVIGADRGRKFDPDIVDAFMAIENRFMAISESMPVSKRL